MRLKSRCYSDKALTELTLEQLRDEAWSLGLYGGPDWKPARPTSRLRKLELFELVYRESLLRAACEENT